jgi:hypothetical protein
MMLKVYETFCASEGKLVPIDVVIGKPGQELRAKIRDLLDVMGAGGGWIFST